MLNLIKTQKTYQEYIKFKIIVIVLMGIITVAAAIFAVVAGSAGLTIKEVLLALVGQGTDITKTVVLNLRLTRVVTYIIGGIGLAVTGCAMQSILQNPLASASTIGVSQGAAFGAAFSIVVLGAGVQFHTSDAVMVTKPYIVSVCAFLFSMLSTLGF